MAAELPTNLLYFGDNLGWLREHGAFPDASVDLVYLDPPFNSNRSYNVLFKESDVRESEAQIHAFEDTWSWDREGRVQEVFDDFWMTAPEDAKKILKALVESLGRNDVTAYLTMMAPRLVELHRVLKPTGSLYLHCDPTASHYLRILLDSIFGPAHFRNEIIWKRTHAHSGRNKLGSVHDVILLYCKGEQSVWNRQFADYSEDYVERFFRFYDDDGRRYRLTILTGSGTRTGSSGKPWRNVDPTKSGRHWAVPGYVRELLGGGDFPDVQSALDKLDEIGRVSWPAKTGGTPSFKQYLTDLQGTEVHDVWVDIPPISAHAVERLGYPTQKPLALLERIIAASSNEGDVVLDPFCGCGTAVHAAQKLGRKWIGIDITPLATNLIKDRLESAFPRLKVPIQGWPEDMAGAVALAAQEDKYHFQDWAVIEAGGRPAGGERKKGADRGVDGVIPFLDGKAPKRGVISVKSGNTGPKDVRDLGGVVGADEDAAFGVFVCLREPTKPMVEAANEQGTWVSDFDGKIYPRVQIMCAQDLIDGKQVRMPGSRTAVFAAAAREKRVEGTQGRLG
jgi:site-specific DNA-methyltransferase (adenine-specific)